MTALVSPSLLVCMRCGFWNPHKIELQMGPSGSGKTTLLDVLAGRKTAGEVKGIVLYAGRPATHQFLRRFTGLCGAIRCGPSLYPSSVSPRTSAACV